MTDHPTHPTYPRYLGKVESLHMTVPPEGTAKMSENSKCGLECFATVP